MDNIKLTSFTKMPTGDAVLGIFLRAAIACLVYISTLIIWCAICSNAFRAIQYAEEEVNAVLSGVFVAHSCFLASAGLFGATIAGLLVMALIKVRQRKGIVDGHVTGAISYTRSQSPFSGQPHHHVETEPAYCQQRAVCTTTDLVYVGFMLWICASLFYYARWMSGALTVAEVAKLSLQRISSMDSSPRDAAARARDPAIAVVAAAGTQRLINLDPISRDDGSAAQGGRCPTPCLDVRQLEFLQSTKCVCDVSRLQGLYDNAMRLHKQLRAALALLLVMYGSAAITLIDTSALLGRTDGRSELDLVLDSAEGDRARLSSRCSSGRSRDGAGIGL
ncbi:hypothetical protein PLESTB_001398800 [Pleodorina starrii]|uniref:Uncharacterized protein n=1 Tax=Pleodorina starrii TaxID=330485 RepID=A0A9W6BUL6_9CHLO|nr:hypothetical protein PLESTM_000533500 [Pleodorina starrii]GLC58766.1 hypothetical protein PLESTB_001398800 [Pleodorina starrii]GLC68699.1 hypothetical protein PLESTF_000725700 [Pleodorina starrii]